MVSTLLFGPVHLLNGLPTGDFRPAALQSVMAFMTGMAFVGIRTRTGSLYPGMVLHGPLDFALIVLAWTPRRATPSQWLCWAGPGS